MMEILERAEKKSSEPTEKQHIEKGDEPESAKKKGDVQYVSTNMKMDMP